MSGSSSSAPRWKALIESAISKFKKQTVFQLSTIETASPVQALPQSPPQGKAHVRSMIFRSFLDAPSRPNLPLLVSSTDIRTPKVTHITSNPEVELAWWIDGTQQQFRLSGRTTIIPSPSQKHLYGHFGDIIKSVNEKGAEDSERASILGVEAVTLTPSFDWEQKRVEVFKSMSGHMKASWCRPTPGTKLEGGQDEAKKWPERLEEPGPDSSEEDRRNWERALGNFALVIIEPTYVDFVDLGVVPNRRFGFNRDENGQWEEVELVP